MGSFVYLDVNSMLCVIYGNVMGGLLKDGLIYELFICFEGIIEKDMGEILFDLFKK